MVGRGLHSMILFRMLLHALQKMHGFMFCKVKPTFFCHLFFNFLVGESTLFCWLVAFTFWLMLSLLTHSNKLGIMGSFFSWDGYDIGNLCERRTLSPLLPNKCVFPSYHKGFCHKSFWVFQQKVVNFFSLMC